MQKLSESLFNTIVENTPLISIDLVIRNESHKVLLGLRSKPPAQGMWFVPGGRIRKDESIKDAFSRLTVEEVGFEIPVPKVRYLVSTNIFTPTIFQVMISPHTILCWDIS